LRVGGAVIAVSAVIRRVAIEKTVRDDLVDVLLLPEQVGRLGLHVCHPNAQYNWKKGDDALTPDPKR
jgi:hypothetical protein